MNLALIKKCKNVVKKLILPRRLYSSVNVCQHDHNYKRNVLLQEKRYNCHHDKERILGEKKRGIRKTGKGDWNIFLAGFSPRENSLDR